MRRAVLLLAAGVVAACGGGTDSNGPPASPYTVTVVSQSTSGGNGAIWSDVITFEVKDKASSAPIQGATVVTQTTAGTVTTLPLITAANGRVTGTWTIDIVDQTSGVIHALAMCAPKVGSSICKTKFGDDNTIKITF